MHVPLRDREFNREELMELENKTWIEMKDMIFETDPNILEYLSYHCKRWRMTNKNGLSEDYKKLKNTLHGGSSRGASGAPQRQPSKTASTSDLS